MSNRTLGINYVIKIADEIVAGQQGGTITFTRELIDTTSKPTSGAANLWRTQVGSIKSFEISGEGIMVEDTDTLASLWTAFEQANPVAVEWIYLDGAADGEKFTSTAVISSLEQSAEAEGEATYSIALSGSGVVNRVEPN